ncbi:MAG: LysM peptidoglycan-binding domain-containing protein [Kofleriaceae bacterium]|nr:LysM peptidoglycan-binding domain-containing protein [Kofleriaceae bacterium]
MRALAIVALSATAVYAQPSVTAGPQSAPPTAATNGPTLAQDADARRIIRGCAVGEVCGRPSDLLREFEVEAFPPPGGNPWIDERVATSKLEAPRFKKVTRPSELRPDQKWLDKLEMPDLPVTWTPRLIEYLLFYKDDPRGRSIMAAWLEAQGRYREMIVATLRKAKLPTDLLYVSMIESSYDTDTLSSAGALGLWQFMRDGGRIYGLRQDRWVDERKDPLRSTMAVVDYWADLYQRFGDWATAMAAYNAGYGAMLRSIARYNTNDYYQLCEYENGLPWEACLYSPKVLATAIVGHNRAVFGFDKIKEDKPEVWDEVAVPTSIPVSVIARASGATEADIKRMNPQLRRDRTPPGEAGYVVRVPRGAKADFQRRLVDLQTDWDGYDAYVMAHGERLEDVATTYGISLNALRKLNGIGRESELEGGCVLVVPRITAEAREKNKAKAKAKLMASGVDHKEGDTLIVPVPDKDFEIAGKRRVFYRVVSGDSVTSVAKAFDVKVREMIAWNGLDDDAKIHPRMVLVAYVDADFDAEKHDIALLDETQLEVVTRGSDAHLDLAEERTGRVRTEYISKGDEKLDAVAKRFGMGSHDLARINRISYNTVLAKGQKIIVYQVADPSRSERAEEQWKKTPKARRDKTAKTRPPRTSESDGPVTRPTQLEGEER